MSRAHSSPSLLIRLCALALWAATLAYLSLASNVRPPSGPLGWDKLHHFSAYAVLAALLLFVLSAQRALSGRILFAAWLTCFGYGLLLELLQWAMAAGRCFELADLFANGLGALLACLFCVLFRHGRRVASQS